MPIGQTYPTGWKVFVDPAGRFLFVENQLSQRHELLTVRCLHHPDRFEIKLLHKLNPNTRGLG